MTISTEIIQFQKTHANAIIPTRGTANSAGFDLYALEDTCVIGGQGSIVVRTGAAVKLTNHTYGRIAMRSGLSVKEHLAVSAGVIDVDYSGEICVVVFCTKNDHVVNIKKGDRFAQLVPEVVCYALSQEVEKLETTHDLHVGWGSTGK